MKQLEKSIPTIVSEALINLSNKFYCVIPFTYGCTTEIIKSQEAIASKMSLLQQLDDIGIGLELLDQVSTVELSKSSESQGPQHTFDLIHKALGANLNPVDKETDEWILINQLMKNSPNIQVKDIFKVHRQEDEERFKSFKCLDNRVLLCHGTGVANTMGILRQGFKIAPPEAPHAGTNFGRGIYFADHPEKSLGYCGIGQGQEGVFFLCEVALGKMKKCQRPEKVYFDTCLIFICMNSFE